MSIDRFLDKRKRNLLKKGNKKMYGIIEIETDKFVDENHELVDSLLEAKLFETFQDASDQKFEYILENGGVGDLRVIKIQSENWR